MTITVAPAACFLSVDRIYMHHTVLYIFEFILDRMMYIFRNIMCIKKGNISICCDLDIHIHLGSEKTGFKKVYSSDARYLEDLSLHEFLSFCITGMIYHLVNGIPENIDRCLCDHKADHNAGDRIQDRISDRKSVV